MASVHDDRDLPTSGEAVVGARAPDPHAANRSTSRSKPLGEGIFGTTAVEPALAPPPGKKTSRKLVVVKTPEERTANFIAKKKKRDAERAEKDAEEVRQKAAEEAAWSAKQAAEATEARAKEAREKEGRDKEAAQAKKKPVEAEARPKEAADGAAKAEAKDAEAEDAKVLTVQTDAAPGPRFADLSAQRCNPFGGDDSGNPAVEPAPAAPPVEAISRKLVVVKTPEQRTADILARKRKRDAERAEKEEVGEKEKEVAEAARKAQRAAEQVEAKAKEAKEAKEAVDARAKTTAKGARVAMAKEAMAWKELAEQLDPQVIPVDERTLIPLRGSSLGLENHATERATARDKLKRRQWHVPDPHGKPGNSYTLPIDSLSTGPSVVDPSNNMVLPLPPYLMAVPSPGTEDILENGRRKKSRCQDPRDAPPAAEEVTLDERLMSATTPPPTEKGKGRAAPELVVSPSENCVPIPISRRY